MRPCLVRASARPLIFGTSPMPEAALPLLAGVSGAESPIASPVGSGWLTGALG